MLCFSGKGCSEFPKRMHFCIGILRIHVNAYTTYYQQGIIGVANTKNIYEAVKLLNRFIDIEQFNPLSIEINKKIIYDEILRQKVKYEQLGYNLALKNAFLELNLADMILGNKESLEMISEDILQKSYITNYSSDKITLLIVGDIDLGSLDEIMYIYFDRQLKMKNCKSKIILPNCTENLPCKIKKYNIEISAKFVTLIYRDMFSERVDEWEMLIVQIVLDNICRESLIRVNDKYMLVSNYVSYTKHLKYFVMQFYVYEDNIDIEYIIEELFKHFEMNRENLERYKKKMIEELLFLEDDLSLLSGELRRLLSINSSLRDKYLFIQQITLEQVLNKYREIYSNLEKYSSCIILEK